MQIEIVNTMGEFEKLLPHWRAVYAADLHARYFIAYPFLHDWLSSFQGNWFILVARQNKAEDPVGFLPLRMRTRALPDGRCVSEVLMAGNYGADYTGMLAMPRHSAGVLAAFAKALETMAWSTLNFDYVAAEDPRYSALAALLPRNGYRHELEERINKRDNVNNLVCPGITLPSEWETYLSGLSANMRQKLRRLLRQLSDDTDLEIVFPTTNTIEQDFGAMAAMWVAKWQERKGEERARSIVATNREMTLRAYASGNLYMPILKHRGQPVAALVTFLDREKMRAHFFMTGRDEGFSGPSPGLLLHAASIRHLIADGYKVYDFMRGDEPYKLLFTDEISQLQCLRIRTRNGQNPNDRLEQMAIPDALALASAAHRRGLFKMAAAGYGQILGTEGNNVDALYRYAQLLEQIGRYDSAAQLFARLVALRPLNKTAQMRLRACLAMVQKSQVRIH